MGREIATLRVAQLLGGGGEEAEEVLDYGLWTVGGSLATATRIAIQL